MRGSITNQHLLHRSRSCRAAPDCREQKALLLLLLSPQHSPSAPRLAGTAPALPALRATAVTKQDSKKHSPRSTAKDFKATRAGISGTRLFHGREVLAR